MGLEEDIIAAGRRLGFNAVGIAAAGPAQTIDRFRDWLAAGHAANMEYLKRAAVTRADPGRLLPNVRSIIVAAACYPANPDPGRGFSTYARGRDYHLVVRAKLTRLLTFINAGTGAAGKGPAANPGQARVCVDASPLLEREWALRAGIGWRGRQNQVVNPEFGCCFVLGEILTDLDLSPSTPMAGGCGDCRRCVEACPTGALRPDGFLDARRCLSYLTVEHKADIPAGIAGSMGETLFGCDFCTAVCPRNRPGDEHVMPELRGRALPDARTCLQMTEGEFKRQFKDTAVLRTGLPRLRRNAAVAAANARAGMRSSGKA